MNMRLASRFVIGLLLLPILVLRAAGEGHVDTFKEPNGAFTITPPEGWKSHSDKHVDEDLNIQNYITGFASNTEAPVSLAIVSQVGGVDLSKLNEDFVVQLSKAYLQGWVHSLPPTAKAGEIKAAKFAGRLAARCEVTYTRGDKFDPRHGYGIFVPGRKFAFVIAVTGSDTNPHGFTKAAAALETLQLEPEGAAK